jgi:hypothetical protein
LLQEASFLEQLASLLVFMVSFFEQEASLEASVVSFLEQDASVALGADVVFFEHEPFEHLPSSALACRAVVAAMMDKASLAVLRMFMSMTPLCVLKN